MAALSNASSSLSHMSQHASRAPSRSFDMASAASQKDRAWTDQYETRLDAPTALLQGPPLPRSLTRLAHAVLTGGNTAREAHALGEDAVRDAVCFGDVAILRPIAECQPRVLLAVAHLNLTPELWQLLRDSHTQDQQFETCLLEAARAGAVRSVKTMLHRGINANILCSKLYWPQFHETSVLYIAAAAGFSDVVRLLLSNGAHAGLGYRHRTIHLGWVTNKRAPISIAVANGHAEVVRIFIEHKPVRANKLRKYLNVADSLGYTEVARVLRHALEMTL